MPSVDFKFNNPKECVAFARLLSFIPWRQRWEDVKGHSDGNTCHICNGNTSVKSGVVSFDDFFEEKSLDGYSFWSCCWSCHNYGWQLPHWVSRGGEMRYWRIGPTTEELIITDSPIFKFPSVMLINTNTVSISV